MPEPAIAVEPASEVDLEAYSAFQREAFRDLLARSRATDAHMTAGHYRWKYHTPVGTGRIASATEGSETLSSSAMLPLRVVVDGEPVTGWHCLDVATLPAARRRGLLLATLGRLVESVPPGDLLFAFPNAGSIGAFAKLGFVENLILTTWINPCVRLTKRGSGRIRSVERFGPEHDGVGSGFGAGRPHVDRRFDYLNWRYADHPGNRYACFVLDEPRGAGICIVRRVRVLDRELALVMEIVGPTAAAQTALLSHAADWAASQGLGTMALMSTPLVLRTAASALLVPVPSFLLPKRQVLVVRRAGAGTGPRVPARWAVQTGDWDVF
jgi:GNAT superfamily N-acetyltransferase